MRLKTIEMEQVGTFAGPMRISNIGPGLNVLAGANELGKSTILRGLTTLFTEQHRTAKASVRDLRPYSGGAPLMACTFDLGDHSWRLEKRYLSAHRALLRRLDGREQHHGADAENRLAELLGLEGALDTSLPLLWIGQGESFEVPVLCDSARHSLGQLLAAQAESTAGVGRAQAVLQAVEAELGELVTKTGKAKKNGSYSNVLAEYAEVSLALEAARDKAAAAEQRIARLAELQDVAAELSDRDATTALQLKVAEHEGRLAGAREARRKLQQLGERIAFLENQKTQRAATLADYDAGLAELRTITAAMAAANVELTTMASRAAELGGQMDVATEAVAVGARREQALRGRLEQARRAVDLASRRERLAQLGQQRERLSMIAEEIAGIDAALADFVWPDAAISRVRGAAMRLDQLHTRRMAVAPRVRFAYAPGRCDGFQVDGVDVADGADVTADGPITIYIEGIGKIEVVPGASETREVLAQDIEATEGALVAGLAVMGASNITDAEAREQRRAALSQARQLLVSEREGLAPGGDERLAAEVARLCAAGVDADDAQEVADARVVPTTADELAAELETAQAAQVQMVAALDALKDEKSRIELRRAEIAAGLGVRRTKRDELTAKYAREEGEADAREELVNQVIAAEQQLNAAIRERIAVQEVALPEVALAELERALTELQARVAQRAERLAVVRQEMRHVEGMLTRDFEDGAGDQVGQLMGRLEELGERRRDSERHVAALRLLAAELGVETAQRRDSIARPLSGRLTAMAARIWPGAEIPLNSDLTVDGLTRGGRREATGAVSAGTREQIAVLARLAYAGMLAEGAGTVPVILDDPLVFSDDTRLDVLFDIIAEAAESHQIIVLTCHERAFEPLITRYGATRLSLAEMAVAA